METKLITPSELETRLSEYKTEQEKRINEVYPDVIIAFNKWLTYRVCTGHTLHPFREDNWEAMIGITFVRTADSKVHYTRLRKDLEALGYNVNSHNIETSCQ